MKRYPKQIEEILSYKFKIEYRQNAYVQYYGLPRVLLPEVLAMYIYRAVCFICIQVFHKEDKKTGVNMLEVAFCVKKSKKVKALTVKGSSFDSAVEMLAFELGEYL